MSQLEDKYKTEKSRNEAIQTVINQIHVMTGGTMTNGQNGARVGGLGWTFQHSANGYRLERQDGSVNVGPLYKKWVDFFEFLTMYRAGISMGRNAMRYELSGRAWKPDEMDWNMATEHKNLIDTVVMDRGRRASKPARLTI